MSRIRFRDDEPSSTTTVLGVLAGAVIGFAVGVYVSDRLGGVSGISNRLRRRAGAGRQGIPREPRAANDFEDLEEFEADELEDEGMDSDVEVRVLEAFRNDTILCERAIDIGSIGQGIVELAGWVDTEEESRHAVTIARGVPGVETVVNRLAIGDDEAELETAARRFADGDPALNEAQWDGHTVGTGRRRQGTSHDVGRHADPRVDLTERWSSAEQALREAADSDGPAGRARGRKAAARGDRATAIDTSASRGPKPGHTGPVDVVGEHTGTPAEERA
jgi:hypothetical protein